MTNIVNLERDMSWVRALAATTPVGGTNYGATPSAVGSGATVEQRVNSFFAEPYVIGTSAQAMNVGCLILPPAEGDVTPYRFKGSAMCSTDNIIAWSYGWYASSQVQDQVLLATGNECDIVAAIAPLDTGDPLYGRPLCFYCTVLQSVAGLAMSAGSVQRMISKPPQFASAVS